MCSLPLTGGDGLLAKLAGKSKPSKSLFAPGELRPSAPRGSYVDPATGNTIIPPGVPSAGSANAFPSLGAASGGVSLVGGGPGSIFATRNR